MSKKTEHANKYDIKLPEKLLSKKKTKDSVRHEITKFLETKQLDIRHKKYNKFNNYLGNKDFLAEIYLILCCGFYDTKQSLDCIKKIVDYFDKESNIITFKELFQLDKDWIPYFSENAYPDGTVKENEYRKGVSKTRCLDIMKIKHLLIDNKNLDTAIVLYDFINIRTFLGNTNSTNLTTF